jgi:RNA polymerase sigma factor (sigma-70 family)
LAEPVSESSPDALYEEAVACFGPALERLARAHEADPEDRRDLLQEIHLALWRSFARFAGRCSLRTWVYQVAHNTAASHISRQRRTLRGSVSLQEVETTAVRDEDGFAADRLLELDELRRAFWVAVALSGASAAVCAWCLHLFPSTVQRIGFALTFAAELWFVYQFVRLRSAGNEQHGMTTAAAYRGQLVRQRDLARNMWWKFLLPIVPGVDCVLLGFVVPELGALRAVVLTSAYMALPFAVAVPLARRKARRLDRELAELDSELG